MLHRRSLGLVGVMRPPTLIQRYLAERTADGITLEQLASLVADAIEGVMTVAVTGSLHPDALALEAAKVHFERYPERTKVFVITTSGPSDR
jgi:hypothetical protein